MKNYDNENYDLKPNKRIELSYESKLIGWCCLDCEENFYLPRNEETTKNLALIHCPYCKNLSSTVMNTIPNETE